MKYFLGIDGGGTKTSYLVLDENKKIVVETTSLGTSLDTYPIQLITKRLIENIENFPYQFSAIYAGLGGITSFEDRKLIIDIIKTAKNVIGPVDADSDVTNALAGALNNEDGIVLIAGTGSVVYGRNKNKTHRAGGYGALEDDIGSAYYLGHYALRYLARVIDKRFPTSDFAEELMKKTNCFDYSSLAKYFLVASRSEIAALAQVVTKHEENYHALEIINDSVKGALLMINTVFRECGFSKTNFSIVGGLGRHNTLYYRLLLKNLDPNIIFEPSQYEPSYGSAILALNLFNSKIVRHI